MQMILWFKRSMPAEVELAVLCLCSIAHLA